MLSPRLGGGAADGPLGGSGTLALCRGGMAGLSAAASAQGRPLPGRCPASAGGLDLPSCTRQALDHPDRSFDRHPHGRHWACLPGSLGVVSCLSPSLPRMLSYTPTRPTAAQAESPCSPRHRPAGDLRSHRLPSLGSSSLVGREHPHRCPGCSAQATVGSPPSRKNRSTCRAAPLNLHPRVC
jgi:hypothetical protein